MAIDNPVNENVPKEYDSLIRATSVGSEQPVFLESLSRWEYMKKYLPDFQDMVDFDVRRYVLGAVGVVLLIMGSPLAIIALAGAAYYWVQFKHRFGQVNSVRRLVLGN